MIYFTSDTHFFHKNIIDYCNRPFSDVDDMTERLIDNWNAYVTPDDVIFHLGDFAFARPELAVDVLTRLNGQKYLIRGNHDHRLVKDPMFRHQWVDIYDYYVLKHEHRKFVLMHFPLMSWENMQHGSIHLHGHSHGNLAYFGEPIRRYDVGVDALGRYYPMSIDGIVERSYTINNFLRPDTSEKQ